MEPTAEVLRRRERDRVDEDVQAAPAPLDLGDEARDVLGLGRVAQEDGHGGVVGQRVDELGDVLLEAIVQVGEGEPRALPLERRRDPPRDAALVPHPDDERLLPLEQTHDPTSRADASSQMRGAHVHDSAAARVQRISAQRRAQETHEVLRLRLVRHPGHAKEREAGLLVRADRGRIARGGPDDADLEAVERERDVAQVRA